MFDGEFGKLFESTQKVSEKFPSGMRRDEIAAEIEDMDMKVEEVDREKFQEILDQCIGEMDPNLDIKSAVIKLPDEVAKNLYDDLIDLHYEEY